VEKSSNSPNPLLLVVTSGESRNFVKGEVRGAEGYVSASSSFSANARTFIRKRRLIEKNSKPI